MSNHNNHNGLEPQEPELGAAMSLLRRAVETPLDANDLGRLAQMHSACQTLAGLGGGAGELAAAVACLLEGVILKEAADTDGGLALIPQAVAELGRAVGGAAIEAAALVAQLGAAARGTGASVPPAAAPAQGAATTDGEAGPPAAATGESEAARPAGPASATAALADAGAGASEPYVSEPLVIDLKEREHLEGFVEEAREHIDAIEVALLELERDPTHTGKINELFRPFHTIKGIAGFLNLRDINRLTHEIETILDLGRKSELTITAETIDLILAGLDKLKQQVAALAGYLAQPTGGPVPQPEIAALMARLRAVARGGVEQTKPAAGGNVATPAAEAIANVSEGEPPGAGGGATTGNGSGTATQAMETSIRVDTGKLDFLVDAVGELVIAQTMVQTSELVARDERLARVVSQVSKIVRDVQETAMAMRMVPIGPTFQKMRRLVRDVARKAGKRVELTISGEDTELDKNVIQAISDPLVHMVRNAVDHGIEMPEQRRAAGKPETGRVHLNACHQGDSIVVEIRDDGRGLDRKRLIAKGIERGLIAADEALTDQEVFQLVLQPGFSTAEQVTEISGRGVGMDVVRRNVEQLRGKIEIESEEGRGAVFRIRLPLTLAIIDGMLVRVGSERLIIPTILIEQSLRPEPQQITRVQRRGMMIKVRGELITLIQLGPLFGYSPPIDPTRGLVVIAHAESHKIGLVVDQLIGQQQVVIKTLGERFKRARGVSGAAILGDGRVGLILEPTGLLALHNSMRGDFVGRGTAGGAAAGAVGAPEGWEVPGEQRREGYAASVAAEPVAASV